MSNYRYENGHNLFNPHQLELLYVSSSVYEGDWHSTLHSHSCTELFYVISGEGNFLVEELSFPVRTDDMVIINPNVRHTETGVPQTPLEYIVMGVNGGEFLLENGQDPRYCTLHFGGNGEVLGLFHEMLAELEQRKPYFDNLAHNLLQTLCFKLLRHQALSLRKQGPAKKHQECAYIKRYIDNHYKENLTLETLAQVAHLNKYYMVHTFTKEYGISPINYLIRRRIDESRHFLTTTDYRISQISQILGFSSPSYFTQCFRRLEGISPRDYRQREAGGDTHSHKPTE